MSESVGAFLKGLRTARGLSQRQLAERAAVAQRTLSYWETDAHQPCLPELEATLDALGATAAERNRAVSLLDAPRARAVARGAAERSAAYADLGAMPSAGDLLRAMRQRRGLFLEQAAQSLSVSPAALSRWERGESRPPPEKLDALLALLRAHPQERDAIRSGFLFLTARQEAADSLDVAYEDFLEFIRASYAYRTDPLNDLRFVMHAATIWPFAARSPAGRTLLSDVYANYASYLAEVTQYKEARRYAQAALNLLQDKTTPQIFHARAAIVCAQADVLCGSRPAPKRGLELLRLWLPATKIGAYKAWMLEDMARYMALEGETESALRLGEEACRVAETECTDPAELRLRRLGLAQLQARAGHPERSLALVEDQADDTPFWRAEIALLRAEACLARGERANAHACLERALGDIESGDLARLRSQAIALAQRL